MEQKPNNAADEARIKDQTKKEKTASEIESEDMKFILNTPQGRRILWKLISFCGVYKQVFTGNSETFFKDGKRVVGLKILADVMSARPEAYLEMMKEKGGDNV